MLLIENLENTEKYNEVIKTRNLYATKLHGDGIDKSGAQERGLHGLDIHIGSPRWISWK